MHLLIIEDDNAISDAIYDACTVRSFACEVTDNGSDGFDMIQLYDYSAVILDLMLPDMSGIDILKKTRAMRKDVPIIVLSGLSSTDDKVKCLSYGADDYLTKPFSKTELLARIDAVVRRSHGLVNNTVEIGPMLLDINKRTVSIYGKQIPLTSKEYLMLEILMLKKGTLITKEVFVNHIYCGMDEPDFKIIDVFICKLRKKIAAMTGGINVIETVWGRGYIIKENCFDNSKKQINHLRVV